MTMMSIYCSETYCSLETNWFDSGLEPGTNKPTLNKNMMVYKLIGKTLVWSSFLIVPK
jgi:hypothetical protein